MSLAGSIECLRTPLDSLTGRIFILLTVGMTIAVMLSLAVAERIQCRQFEHLRAQAVVESAADIAESLSAIPARTEQMLQQGAVMGARAAPSDWIVLPDAPLSAAMRVRVKGAHGLIAGPASMQCRSLFGEQSRRFGAGLRSAARFDCWYVRYTDARGEVRSFVVTYPGTEFPRTGLINPVFFLLFFLASGLLSVLVSRWITRPVVKLAQAAHGFGLSLDPEMVTETGPSEVRAALSTFNLMQRRVTDGFRQRTGLLASISHDLQTPLTRLRLRLEGVENRELRSRLVEDLSAMQRLVREGLELARSSENAEDWSWVDLDSMLASVAEDAQELGGRVDHARDCGITIRVKPGALSRCIDNLVDNALKYAGAAEISCGCNDGGPLVLTVLDKGPGIPPDQLARMFEPFVRGDVIAVPGTGIGLSIARAQAATFDAQIILSNQAGGGLSAAILFGSATQWRREERSVVRQLAAVRNAA